MTWELLYTHRNYIFFLQLQLEYLFNYNECKPVWNWPRIVDDESYVQNPGTVSCIPAHYLQQSGHGMSRWSANWHHQSNNNRSDISPPATTGKVACSKLCLPRERGKWSLFELSCTGWITQTILMMGVKIRSAEKWARRPPVLAGKDLLNSTEVSVLACLVLKAERLLYRTLVDFP